jgi:hypothetical protein
MRDRLLFSYATHDDPALKRLAIRTIERVTGQPRLQRLYVANQRRPRAGESFWDAVVRQLALRIDHDPARLAAIPRPGEAGQFGVVVEPAPVESFEIVVSFVERSAVPDEPPAEEAPPVSDETEDTSPVIEDPA